MSSHLHHGPQWSTWVISLIILILHHKITCVFTLHDHPNVVLAAGAASSSVLPHPSAYILNGSRIAIEGIHSRKQNHGWDEISDSKLQTILKKLEKHQLSTALLHFIEVTQNGTGPPCIRTSLEDLKYRVPQSAFQQLTQEATVAIRTANMLTKLFTHGYEVSTVIKKPFLKKNFFWSLGRINLELNPTIFSSGIAFKPEMTFPLPIPRRDENGASFLQSNGPESSASGGGGGFAPFAYRMDSTRDDGGWKREKNKKTSIVYRDLARIKLEKGNSYAPDDKFLYIDHNWFKEQSEKNYREVFRQKHLHFNSDSGGEELIRMGLEDGFWTSPYLDCNISNIWLLSFSVPFFGPALSADHTTEFKYV